MKEICCIFMKADIFLYKRITSNFSMNFDDKKKFIYLFSAFISSLILLSAGYFIYKAPKKQELISSFELKQKDNREYHIDEITINKGDTMFKILSPYTLSAQDIHKIIKIAKPKIDMTNLKIGQILQVKYKNDSNERKIPISFQIEIDAHKKLKIYKEDYTNNYKTNDITINYDREIIKVDSRIQDSIMATALKAGIPIKNILELINTYSNQIDFQREVREGDKFTILFEKFTSEDNKSVYFGKTLFSSLNLRGNKYNIYRFKRANGTEDFFDENYSSVKRSLLKTPVMAARISSKFGLRKHPVLGFTQMHRGVDFAAPKGTPIYAAGNGTIIEIGRKGSYGKYIKIKHNQDIYTAYGHAKSFAKGLTKGSLVKQGQVIAYVGDSGMATGAHLHFEVIEKGKKVNPLKLKLIPVTKLAGKDRENFLKYKATLDEITSSNQPQMLASASLQKYIF